MESWIFTHYVRSLEEGKPPDERRHEAAWKALRTALRGEIKRRGLWESPPAYLGVFGWESWEAAGSARGAAGKEGALEELLTDCYSYIFVSRLRNLRAQLHFRSNIDGLIFLNIRHFLYERQRQHDPMGLQVFEVLQTTIRTAVEEGELMVLGGDERIRNGTVLGFAPGAEPRKELREMASLVARWNDELLPDLVTLRGQRQVEVVCRLRERLPELRSLGIEAFRFKDLIDPLKADVRSRWAAILERSQGEVLPQVEGEGSGEVVRIVRPDTVIEDWQVFRKLVDCVLKALRRLDVNETTRRYLATLWQFVRVQASEGAGLEPASRLDRSVAAALALEDDEKQPSLRQLAAQLAIPRERLRELYGTLGNLMQGCRRALAAGVTRLASHGEASNGTAEKGDSGPPAGAGEGSASSGGGDAPLPAPGDLFVLPATAGLAVEWAILDRRQGKLLAVPADTHPLAGSADFELPAGSPAAPLTLRCGFGVWLEAAVLERARRTGALAPEAVAEARERWRGLADRSLEVSPLAEEIDFAPEYQDWIREVPERARELALASPRPGLMRFPLRSFGVAHRLAAMLALATIGLSLWVVRLSRELDRFSGPVFDPPSANVDLGRAVRGGTTARVPRGASHVLVVMVIDPSIELQDGYLEIVRRSGESVWQSPRIRLVANTEMKLLLPRKRLPDGDYRVRVYPQSGFSAPPLAAEPLRVETEE